jgi:hypothetical protein
LEPLVGDGIDVVTVGNASVHEQRAELGVEVLGPDAARLESMTDLGARELNRVVQMHDSEASRRIPSAPAPARMLR